MPKSTGMKGMEHCPAQTSWSFSKIQTSYCLLIASSGLRVDFETIFNLNWLIFSNANSYQYPHLHLVCVWLKMELCARYWSTHWTIHLVRQESLDGPKSKFIKPLWTLIMIILGPVYMLQFMSCSVVVKFQPSLCWPCLLAMNILYFLVFQEHCSYGIWQCWEIMGSW